MDQSDTFSSFPKFAHIKFPKPAQAITLPQCIGSSDSLLIAGLAARSAATKPSTTTEKLSTTHLGSLLVVITADTTDSHRLAQEIIWFNTNLRVMLLPDWETLPYDAISPHQDLISERLSTLYALKNQEIDVLIIASTTALHLFPPPSFLAAYTFFFNKNQNLDEVGFREQLTLAGYDNVSQVGRPGEYSIRGGLIDLFPMGSVLPYRLDLLGDIIESIRTFDPDTQRSLYPVDKIRLLPAKEFPFDTQAKTTFRNRWRERFEKDPSKTIIYRDVGNGLAPAGIEYWLPLFHEKTATIWDYLPQKSISDSKESHTNQKKPTRETYIVTHGDIQGSLLSFHRETLERYKFLSHDPERPILRPDELFMNIESFFAEMKRWGRWTFPQRLLEASASLINTPETQESTLSTKHTQESVQTQLSISGIRSNPQNHTKHSESAFACLPPVAIDRRDEQPLRALNRFLEDCKQSNSRVLILAESSGRKETISNLFSENGIRLPSIEGFCQFLESEIHQALAVGSVYNGFTLVYENIALITETELFAHSGTGRLYKRKQQKSDVDSMLRDLSELEIGNPVVHAQHGVGRYKGLITLDLGEGPTEFLHLVYAHEATLYVPVAQLHLISRYSGTNADHAPLNQLGSDQWEKSRARAAKQARDSAAELLNLYARRAAREGHTFHISPKDYLAFSEAFGFEETPDQKSAIEAVIKDMSSNKPMDRLVCGDVGFGKTEVALRAAFIAAADQRQVAILTPTTLLAEQHFQTFSDRFSSWPIEIRELSRFKSPKEVKKIISELNQGKIDIVIGTHKILSKDVQFPNLGLVIIDEEHRFGVKQKELLKTLRAQVDVLALTATPIPRTLAMSLDGIRDFSVIATAPQKRLSIKTFVRSETESIIREALLRELRRGGQAYFLYNEVETIENRRKRLEDLVPEARIVVAHGQMPERELERVMRQFHQQRFNILLCTTIIETGIDVPTANTIVIHRADRFGLGQLHQLRGRVGRSHHQAYAYLLIPGESGITKDAKKRLDAIQKMEELGSGFYLAMHDLEIRGAGEILGEGQSGNLQEVGFNLYSELLSEAVKALQSGKEPDLAAPLSATTEIKLHVPALLPEHYCKDVHERLVLYKRMANCSSEDSLIEVRESLIDRFGAFPEPAQALLETHRLRIMLSPLGISLLDASPETLILQFTDNPAILPEKLVEFVQKRSNATFSNSNKLRINHPTKTLQERIQFIKDVIGFLTNTGPDNKPTSSKKIHTLAQANPSKQTTSRNCR